MGYTQATCETEVARATEYGSSCSEMQIWRGKLEDFCCSSCNDGATCIDRSSALDPYFGPGLMTCTAAADEGLCEEQFGGRPLHDYCPISCGICTVDTPTNPVTTMAKVRACDYFPGGS